MIISASRRTDIPTYYSDWFYNRVKEGYVFVRNPMNTNQVSKIDLSPDIVDGIVFWTKNPVPMIERLNELENYTYYFQFTLNAYGIDIEPNIPSKNDVIIPSFQKLSNKIGKDKVIWRYDPILFNEKYTLNYHLKYFKIMASKLSNYTEKCTISFVDFYRNTKINTKQLNIIEPSHNQKLEFLQELSKIASDFGLYIDTCAEDICLDKLGIKQSKCIDKERFERLAGYKLTIGKDKNQRPECGCFESIDIGAYNTCNNGCLYCYANYSYKTVHKNFNNHNSISPLISGELSEEDIIKVRKVESCRNCQYKLFD